MFKRLHEDKKTASLRILQDVFNACTASPRDEKTPEGFVDVNEAASRLNIKPMNIHILCATGRIQGAVKIGTKWYIPEESTGRRWRVVI